MQLTLHTADLSRGFMVEWLLEELGVPYIREIVDLFSGETKSDGYRAIHPLGSVPALLVDGVPHMESLAMMLFLADAYPEAKLAPGLDHPSRSHYLQWMVYCTATLEPALGPAFVRSLSVDLDARKTIATPEERQDFHRKLAPLSPSMAEDSVLAMGLSAVDVVLGSELYWAEQVGLLSQHQIATDYLARMVSRPAFQTCQAREARNCSTMEDWGG
jgi:glutathione S-transferase